jgi:tape measure domain-containing protein
MTTRETFGIDIEIKPDRSGKASTDRDLKQIEEQGKRANREIARAARERAQEEVRASAAAAAAIRRHEREIAAEARAAAAAGKMAKREVSHEARRAAAEARAAAAVERKAAQDAAAAQRALAREVAATTRELRRQAEAAAATRAGSLQGRAGSLVTTRLLPAAAGAMGVAAAGQMADTWIGAANKINQLVDSEAELVKVQRELFASAQEVGVLYGDHVALYQRVGKAALGLGRSQEQAIALTEMISKAIVSSGADANSASAAIMQLGQALDSGKLRGEEFNSVSEQAPILLEILSKSLGKTRGELRAMADAGELTSKVVIEGLEKGGPAVDKAWGKRIPTLNEQWTRFKNNLTKTFGELAQKTNLAENFGKALSVVADAMGAIANIIGVTVGAIQNLNDAFGGLPLELIDKLVKLTTSPLRIVGDIGKTPGPVAGHGGESGRDAEARMRGEMAAQEYQEREFQRRADAATAARFSLLGEAMGVGFADTGFGVSSADFDRVMNQRAEMEAARAAEESRLQQQRVSGLLAGPASQQSRAATPGGRSAPLSPEAQAEFERSYYEGEAADRKLAESRAEKQKESDKAAEVAAAQRAQAAERLRSEYDRFTSSLSSVAAAEAEVARTEELLARAQAEGLVSGEQAAEQLARKRDLLRDQLDPLGAVHRALLEERDLMLMTNREREIEAERRRIVVDLQRQGITVSAAENEQLRAALETQQRIREEHEKQLALREVEKTHGADVVQDRFRAAMKSAEAMRAELALVEEQKKKALDQQWKDDVARELGGGFDAALQSVMGFRDGLKEAVADMAKSIALLTAKMLLLKAIRAGFGEGGVVGDKGFGLGGFLASIVGGGMAHGGTYTAPGSGGGVDSVPVMFRVTPGERITFTPPGMTGPGAGGGGSAGVGAPPVILNARVINVGDPAEAALAALNSQPGEQLIWNVLAKSPGKLKQLVSG